MTIITYIPGLHFQLFERHPGTSSQPLTGTEATARWRCYTQIRKTLLRHGDSYYPGHFIRPGRLELAGTTTTVIHKLQDPTIQTKVPPFLGLCNIFRRFLANISRPAALLNKTLQKETPKSFPFLAVQGRHVVDGLKKTLTSPLILALPLVKGRRTLYTGTCNTEVGYVLLRQQLNRTDKPVIYCHRTLGDTEKKWQRTFTVSPWYELYYYSIHT